MAKKTKKETSEPIGDTIREPLSPFWDLCQKYSVGDKIVKLKGTKEILLIKQNDTLRVRLYYKREELQPICFNNGCNIHVLMEEVKNIGKVVGCLICFLMKMYQSIIFDIQYRYN